MATARTESMGPMVMGLNKQNGQLRGQTKPLSQSGPHSVSTPPGKMTVGGGALKPGGGTQEGGIRWVPQPPVKFFIFVVEVLVLYHLALQ